MAINNEALQQQLIKDLLIESFEGLDHFDREMLALEKGEGKPETLNIVFRVIHTIKGTAGCIGLGKIESVAHVGENLLSLLRDGKLKTNPPMIAALLEYSDSLKEMLHSLEQTGQQGDKDYSILLAKLQALQTDEPVIETKLPAAASGWGLFEDDAAIAVPESAAKPGIPAAVKPLSPEKSPFAESPA